jgi:hypothetical protein
MGLYHIYSVIKYKYVGVTEERNALALLLQWRGPYLNPYEQQDVVVNAPFF